MTIMQQFGHTKNANFRFMLNMLSFYEWISLKFIRYLGIHKIHPQVDSKKEITRQFGQE